MGTNSNINWEKIQQGVNEVERLIGQKEYNSAMITAREHDRLPVQEPMDQQSYLRALPQDSHDRQQSCP